MLGRTLCIWIVAVRYNNIKLLTYVLRGCKYSLADNSEEYGTFETPDIKFN